MNERNNNQFGNSNNIQLGGENYTHQANPSTLPPIYGNNNPSAMLANQKGMAYNQQRIGNFTRGGNRGGFNNPQNNPNYNYPDDTMQDTGRDNLYNGNQGGNNFNQNQGAMNIVQNQNQQNQDDFAPGTILRSKQEFLRSGFVKKVYGILSVQLLITSGFVALSASSASYNKFLAQNPALLGLAAVIYLACAFTIICCRKVARKVPGNYVILFVLTFACSYLVSASTATVDHNTLILASVLTVTMVVGLTLYAINAKTDFTTMGGTFCVGSLVLFVASFMQIFVSSPWLDWFVSVFGLVLFCGYLIYDTQMIIGGKHKRANMLSIDDYIFAALMLYVDIIVIFLKILEILGRAQGDR